MPSPTVIIRDERLAAMRDWLKNNGWTPTATSEYDYAPAIEYARTVLGVPRLDRARHYAYRAARQLRGEYINLHAGRPVKNVKISVEEYQKLLDAAKNNGAK